MEQSPYTVIRFDKSSFHTLFSDDSDRNIHTNKIQIKYLGEYLDYLKAKTIIIENNYIDRSYLEDYSSYYSRCFNSYDKKCKRLHFFKDYKYLNCFSDEEFRQWMFGEEGVLTNQRLKDNYLGFIVRRPLPETVIGRTCLETYPEADDTKNRHFPVVKEYEVGLCGLRLKAKSTLPFQEQDKITSACATSALWSLFHATSVNSRQIKSPSNITQIATSGNYSWKNDLPTPGLTPEMMGAALKSEGLESLVINLRGDYPQNAAGPLDKAKRLIYPYLRNGIPSLLAVDVFKKDDTYTHRGRHAITVCGYSIRTNTSLSSRNLYDFVLKSDFIDKIYVHDDQIGPFVKLDINENEIFIDKTNNSDFKEENIKSYFSCDLFSTDTYAYLPSNLIIGLYHKIRIPFIQIKDCSAKFSDFLYEISTVNNFVKEIIYKNETPLLWEIYLTTATDLKEEILSSKNIKFNRKQTLLNTSLPKYIWISKAKNSNGPIFDLIFDATDIPQGTIFIDIIERDKDFQNIVDVIFSGISNIPEKIRKDKYGTIYKVLRKIYGRKRDRKPDLADKYGFSRPPIYFRDYECNNLGEIIKHPNIINGDQFDDYIFTEGEYIWAISEEGEIKIAPQISGYGHPSLVDGGYARICGELKKESNGYFLNNASGRYSKNSPSGNGEFLHNAKLLLEENLKKLVITSYGESSYHGTLSITSKEDFIKTISDMAKDSAGSGDNTAKILWQIGRRSPLFRDLFCEKTETKVSSFSTDELELLKKYCNPTTCLNCFVNNQLE